MGTKDEARSLLARARAAGLDIRVDGNKLVLHTDRKFVSPVLIEDLKRHKAMVLDAIAGPCPPRVCPRHALLASCVAPPVQQLKAGQCACCDAAIPEDQSQCQPCHENIRRVLGPGPEAGPPSSLAKSEYAPALYPAPSVPATPVVTHPEVASAPQSTFRLESGVPSKTKRGKR